MTPAKLRDLARSVARLPYGHIDRCRLSDRADDIARVCDRLIEAEEALGRMPSLERLRNAVSMWFASDGEDRRADAMLAALHESTRSVGSP